MSTFPTKVLLVERSRSSKGESQVESFAQDAQQRRGSRQKVLSKHSLLSAGAVKWLRPLVCGVTHQNRSRLT